MSFDPLLASDEIIDSYHDYVKSTFYIRDDDFRKQFEDIVSQRDFAKGPYVDCVDSFETSSSIRELINLGVLVKDFDLLFKKKPALLDRKLYTHQVRSIHSANNDKNLVVTTGTGSGKTECFLYPVLNYLLKEKNDRKLSSGVRALLLYPMNALANDQLLRLRELLEYCPEITFGSYTGETERTYKEGLAKFRDVFQKNPLPNELISRDMMLQSPPHILLTNYAMLEYLLLRPRDTVFFDGESAKSWKFIVLDEAHSYRGATGMEVSFLIRRLVNRLVNNKNIRFFLTSATLGGPEKNDEIKDFAANISNNSKFDDDDIIRAIRCTVDKPVNCIEHKPELYHALVTALDQNIPLKEKVIIELERLSGFKSSAAEADFDQYLYDFVLHDQLYYSLRSILNGKTLPIDDITCILGISRNNLTDFINFSVHAKKDNLKMLDIRYHLFIRTMEGAYVTFYPQKTLSIQPRKEAVFEDKTFPCFKISVCQYCGEIYLEGNVDQKTHVFDQSSLFRNKIYMIVDQKYFESGLDDEDDIPDKINKTFALCCCCRTLSPYQGKRGALSCGCQSDMSILLFEVASKEKEDDDAELHRCQYCHAINPRGSVLRGFYVGHNAAASVIGSSLYEKLPLKVVRDKEMKKGTMGRSGDLRERKETKQLLIFSDNRQDAAYFASYFQFTYDNIIRRRLLLTTARELSIKNKKNQFVLLDNLVAEVARNLELQHMCTNIESEREAWKILLYEMKSGDRNGLCNLGLIQFEYISNFDQGYGVFPDVSHFQQIDRLLMENFLKEGAVFCPVSLTAEDIRYYMYQSRKNVFSRGPKTNSKEFSSNTIKYWISSNNSRTDLLRKTKRFGNDSDITAFLGDFFEAKVNEPDNNASLRLLDGGYQLASNRIAVLVDGVHDISWFICSKCGRLVRANFMKICTNNRCEGDLLPVDTEKFKNYQRNQFIKGELFPMISKEHTAQLSHKTAREYQNKFIEGDIQVLSSSTTFEMGVDVGDLETVFMRNMPPSPSNYIQRAGRAGRRSDSAAFALTFCKLSNHDFTFFKNPERMIKGEVLPPVFKLTNEKIIRRHVYSSLLSFFWRIHADIKTIEEIFNDSIFTDYKNYLCEIPETDLNYIECFTMDCLKRDELGKIIEEYGRGDGLLDLARDKYLDEIKLINTLIEDKKKLNEFNTLASLGRSLNTINGQKIIDYFSRNNLIPKYGFPVDTVELSTDLGSFNFYGKSMNRLKLQRDLIQAISEYAPGSEVVADGYVYVSQYIKRPVSKKKNWKQFMYAECKNEKCRNLNILDCYEDNVLTHKDHECVYCHQKLSLEDVFIIPEYGFVTSIKPPEKSTTKTLKKTYRTRKYYIGDGLDRENKDVKDFFVNKHLITVSSTENDEMAVINKSKFNVCHICGYSEISEKKYLKKHTKDHKTPSGYDCINKALYQKSLGYTFRTDVAAITFNEFLGDNAISVLYTLLEGLCKYFDIERNNIDGSLVYRNNPNGMLCTYFILFDTVPGGAGNTNRLISLTDNKFKDFLRACYDVVYTCTCGDKSDGNTACYSCLCNYYNQSFHDTLNRRAAFMFLEKFIL